MTGSTTPHHAASSSSTTAGASAPTDLDPRGGLSGHKGDLHHTYWTDAAHSGITGNKVTIDYTKYTRASDCKTGKPCGY